MTCNRSGWRAMVNIGPRQAEGPGVIEHEHLSPQ